ncbi:MAG: hypothetical protein LBF22_08890, partial [Deltaproteobacteria bacterium]|nr:hypothetical protein [Deltaproteobacteria bacterium]
MKPRVQKKFFFFFFLIFLLTFYDGMIIFSSEGTRDKPHRVLEPFLPPGAVLNKDAPEIGDLLMNPLDANTFIDELTANHSEMFLNNNSESLDDLYQSGEDGMKNFIPGDISQSYINQSYINQSDINQSNIHQDAKVIAPLANAITSSLTTSVEKTVTGSLKAEADEKLLSANIEAAQNTEDVIITNDEIYPRESNLSLNAKIVSTGGDILPEHMPSIEMLNTVSFSEKATLKTESLTLSRGRFAHPLSYVCTVNGLVCTVDAVKLP